MDLFMPQNMYMNYSYDRLLWKISKIKSGDVVRLDLSKIIFIRPEAIILLIILSYEIFVKLNEPIEWININNEVHLYLERMDLEQLDFVRIQPVRKQIQWKKSKKDSFNLTELLIIKKPKDCEAVMKRTKEMIIKWFPDKVGQDYCRILPTLITEIAGNSLDHSTHGICYFVAQKYITSLSTKIVVSFGDSGIGIQKSLKNSNQWIANNDVYAIKKAFLEGASCRLDRSGGLGFHHVRAVLQKYGGEIIIRSGTGVISYNPKQDLRTNAFRNPLPGTQTVFIL